MELWGELSKQVLGNATKWDVLWSKWGATVTYQNKNAILKRAPDLSF